MTVSMSPLAGGLVLRPGAAEPIACARPMVSAALMRRLVEGRCAAQVPALLGTAFALGAATHRATARRAVAAALGLRDDAESQAADALTLALAAAREHLQRFALDLPALAPQPGIDLDPRWLREAPVLALPVAGVAATPTARHDAAAALPGWLEQHLLGCAPAHWLRRWSRDGEAWLSDWAGTRAHPLAQWLRAIEGVARATALPCRALPLPAADDGAAAGSDAAAATAAGMAELAAALAAQDDYAERPLWRGAPAETGPWTRAARPAEAARAMTPWARLGSRLADLAAIAAAVEPGREPQPGAALACGALPLGAGEGIAWSEMARGLLVHWVRLDVPAGAGPLRPTADRATVARYRVLAPTEWNFHPEGALGRALAAGRLGEGAARLAALALDPCVSFEVVASPPCTR